MGNLWTQLDVVKRANASMENDRPEENVEVAHFLSDEQVGFFRKYGFMVIKGLIDKERIEKARNACIRLIQEDREKPRIPTNAFSILPEGMRDKWADCRDPDIRDAFKDPKNIAVCRHLIGDFNFENHKGLGAVTFAPRFKWFSTFPSDSTYFKPLFGDFFKNMVLISPYDTKNFPPKDNAWKREMILAASDIGIQLAPHHDSDANNEHHWHVDGMEHYGLAHFNLIWGAFLSDLPMGNMGNLIVFPGSHHVIHERLRDKGARHRSPDGKEYLWHCRLLGESPSARKFSLERPGVCDGRSVELIAEAGDVVLMHPFLAHGVGLNVTDNPRLAFYARLSANEHRKHRERMKNRGDELGPGTWVGDIFNLMPGVQ